MSKNETRKICVAVRIRPINEREISLHDKSIWRCDNKNKAISLTNNESSTYSDRNIYPLGMIIKKYILDAVFDENCSSEMVYNQIASPLIDDILRGINGTLFAYGQTSSGKTFTMQGTPDNPGMLYLAVNDIFRRIANTPERQFIIRVSYIEIYNEVYVDLLNPNISPQIHENNERGVHLDSKEITLTDINQIKTILENGEKNRHIGSTKMNERSSRSHTIFRITIESQLMNNSNNNKLEEEEENDENNNGTVLVGVLNLVDLAGSENAKMTEASGTRLKEAGNINRSLSTLSLVISQLSNNSNKGKNGFINFRNSKLTFLLKPSLNGNTRTAIIACISPSSSNKSESESTLRFACSARNIQTTTHVNAVFSENLKGIETLKLEKEELKHELEESDKLNNELNQMINEYMKKEEIYNNVKNQLKKMNERYFSEDKMNENNKIENENGIEEEEEEEEEDGDDDNNVEIKNDENEDGSNIIEVVNKINSEINNIINEIKEKEKERYEKYKRMNEINKNYEIPINTKTIIQNDNTNMKNIINHVENELINFNEYYHNKFIEFESVKRQNDSLKIIIVEKEKKILEYKKNMENGNKINEELRNQYNEISKRYEELTNINKENEITKNNLLKELEEEEKEISILKIENENKSKRIEELDRKKVTQDMIERVDEILKENKMLKINNENLSKSIEEIKNERKMELKKMKDKVMKEKILNDLKKEVIRYKTKYEKLKKMNEFNISSGSEKENLSTSIFDSSIN